MQRQSPPGQEARLRRLLRLGRGRRQREPWRSAALRAARGAATSPTPLAPPCRTAQPRGSEHTPRLPWASPAAISGANATSSETCPCRSRAGCRGARGDDPLFAGYSPWRAAPPLHRGKLEQRSLPRPAGSTGSTKAAAHSLPLRPWRKPGVRSGARPNAKHAPSKPRRPRRGQPWLPRAGPGGAAGPGQCWQSHRANSAAV